MLGVLPVVLALVIVTVVFTARQPERHVFLSPANLVNLFDQSAVFIVLAMAEGFVLLLGEIDLSDRLRRRRSAGSSPPTWSNRSSNLPWWVGDHLPACWCAAGIGADPRRDHHEAAPAGVRRDPGRLPALVRGDDHPPRGRPAASRSSSTVLPNQQVLYGIVNSNIEPMVAWIGLAVIVVGAGRRDLAPRRAAAAGAAWSRRRSA